MKSLKQAAVALGYSVSGLRKLCARGDVRFFQSRPHAPLKFQQEWLDEFIKRGSTPDEPVVRTRKAKTKPAIIVAGFGFNSALLDI
jgi:hypothetical protein